jgi:GT2 family glycosyltransferase
MREPVPGASRPSVSIVVPFRGTIGGLTRLCAALAAQAYPPDRFEVIVVDDGSGAPMDVACRPLTDRGYVLTVITNPATLGRARSRNIGAGAARGEILVFIDSDDAPDAGYVDRIAAQLTARGRRVALRTNQRVHADLVRRSHFARFQDSRHVGSLLARGRLPFDPGALPPKYVSTASLALWTRDFAAVGRFDDAFTAYGGEDEEFGLRLRQAGITIAFASDALIWDGDAATSLDRLCARIPEYVHSGLSRVVAQHPGYVRLSGYARLAFGDDPGTAVLIGGLSILRTLGVIAAVRWILARVDAISWLPVPHRLYELVIAAEVAAARPRHPVPAPRTTPPAAARERGETH